MCTRHTSPYYSSISPSMQATYKNCVNCFKFPLLAALVLVAKASLINYSFELPKVIKT